MVTATRLLGSALLLGVAFASLAVADEPAQPASDGCVIGMESSLADSLWTKVLSRKCLSCHRRGGDAEESQLILVDPRRMESEERAESFRQNLAALIPLALADEEGESRLLRKVIGELDHGGEAVLQHDSPDYRLLAELVRRLNQAESVSPLDLENLAATPLFDGVRMLDAPRLLRRATLSLAGRLPTESELAAVSRDGQDALPEILDEVMNQEAFFDRLREGFNDIFLIAAVEDNPEVTALSYEHFEDSRLWYQKADLSHIEDERERERAGYKIANDYRRALLDEPMKLIEYIVREDRPFTEIVTADYILVSPYTARGYGIFDEIRSRFADPDDPFEYIPVKLQALQGRNKAEYQDSPTGFYPHAGMLSTFLYLARYPTTETNRNRLRARMYYQHFLGVDVLALAARVSDAAAVTAEYPIPTMQAADCVVCHRTLDPVAGLFQDYWRFNTNLALYGKRKEGWFTDMFAPGFEGEPLPESERWRALQWLGEQTAEDPRFAVAMVEHVYYILTGRPVSLPPEDFEDPRYSARLRAHLEQQRETERIAAEFAGGGFNLKEVFKAWILSDFYRADGLASAIEDPCREAELEDIGLVRMLAPEQLERKIAAVFGEKWDRLNDELAMLYGGIDLKEVTQRASDPSGAMGAIQRIMSNDVACRHVALDFARPRDQRLLFPGIEPDVLPGTPEGDQSIREAAARLHQRILGSDDPPDSPDVRRTAELFADIVAEAQQQDGLDRREAWSCRQGGALTDDPHYTIRAWRAVVTYLLRRPEFLYE